MPCAGEIDDISHGALAFRAGAGVRQVPFLSQEDQLVLSVEKRAGLPLRDEALEQYKKTYPEFDMIDESLGNVRP